jgi:hypothetical protein
MAESLAQFSIISVKYTFKKSVLKLLPLYACCIKVKKGNVFGHTAGQCLFATPIHLHKKQ